MELDDVEGLRLVAEADKDTVLAGVGREKGADELMCWDVGVEVIAAPPTAAGIRPDRSTPSRIIPPPPTVAEPKLPFLPPCRLRGGTGSVSIRSESSFLDDVRRDWDRVLEDGSVSGDARCVWAAGTAGLGRKGHFNCGSFPGADDACLRTEVLLGWWDLLPGAR